MKPQYLLIGDSIRMHYSPLVRKKLRKKAQLIPIKMNCSDSEVIKKNLPTWLRHRKIKNLKVIHFNCGLHDIKRPFGSETNQIPIDKYEENLRGIVQILREKTQAQLIWATTTPVIYERHHANKPFDRHDDIVSDYNRVANRVMNENNIPINDLHKIIQDDSPEICIKKDGVHMTERGNQLLSTAVSQALQKYI